jgi:hypothetical protein
MAQVMHAVAKQIPLSKAGSLRGVVAGFSAAEGVIALLLAAAIWAPPFAGGKAWPPAAVLLFAFAAYTAVRARAFPPVPAVLVVYVGAYAVAAIHGGSLGPSDAARYFIRPLVAVAVAAIVTTPLLRRRVLLLIVLFAATQIPVTAVQAIENTVKYADPTAGADSVTGTLGASQAGIVTLLALAAATLVIGSWLAGFLDGRRAAVAGVALAAVGVFTSTRAVLVFVVIVALAIAVCALAFGAGRPSTRKLAALVAASVVLVPALYGSTRAIYPHAFDGLISSQETDVLGGAVAQGVPARETRSTKSKARKGGAAGSVTRTVPAAPPQGVELLPGRFAQLRLALRLSFDGGVTTTLFGRGPGAAKLDPSYVRAQDVPLAQRTGSTWIGLILTETGWVGVAAFAALLIWLAVAGRTLWRRAVPASSDRGLAAVLPGLAALTALGAVFGTILDVRAYSLVFWVLVGVTISAVRNLPEDHGPANRNRSRVTDSRQAARTGRLV